MAPRKKAVEAEVEVMAVAEVQADVSPMAYSKQVGDIQGKAKLGIATALMVGFVPDADLLNANHPANKAVLSGKKAGAVYGSGTGDVRTLVVAKGSDNKEVWVKQGVTANKTPVGALPANKPIGDIQRKVVRHPVAAMELPVVTAAELASGDATINSEALAGKRLGAMVVEAASGVIYVAEGKGPQAKWTPQTSAAAQVTPTAPTAFVKGPLGDKPRKAKKAVVCAVGVPIVAQAQLTAKTSITNDTRLSGKALGALVATVTAGVTSIHMAVGSTNTAKWVNIKTDAAVTPA